MECFLPGCRGLGFQNHMDEAVPAGWLAQSQLVCQFPLDLDSYYEPQCRQQQEGFSLCHTPRLAAAPATVTKGFLSEAINNYAVIVSQKKNLLSLNTHFLHILLFAISSKKD